MKRKKLKLDDLKVKSFVTEEQLDKGQTVKGGARSGFICTLFDVCDWTDDGVCPSLGLSDCHLCVP